MAVTGYILACLGGCAPTPTIGVDRFPTAPNSDSIDSSSTATTINMLSRSELADEPDSRILQAAMLFISTGDVAQSSAVLALVNPDNLTDDLFVKYSLLAAELNIKLEQWPEALDWFQQERFQDLSMTLARPVLQRSLSLQSAAHYGLGNVELGLILTMDLAQLATKKAERLRIHNTIWRKLNQQPYSFLQGSTNHENGIFAGWLSLAALARNYQTNQNAQRVQFKAWRLRRKSHPAALWPPLSLSKKVGTTKPPLQVALLLPLLNEYEVPSHRFIDGFMVAYYELLAQFGDLDTDLNRDIPSLRIYDTSEQPIQTVYNRAVINGADMIVGPMRQSAVDALLAQPALPVPTISLNRSDNTLLQQPENLFQFGLSPTDEMTQIAERAWHNGQRNVVIIAPENGWGARATKFFSQYWIDKGGTVLDAVPYGQSVNDFTTRLKKPLQISLSEDRGVQLKRFINSRIEFSARRRQDIDLVVMLGYPVKARQIKPALDFLYASDIPVYSTSHIYNGVVKTGPDRDLSGVEFVAMPWTLPGSLATELQPDERLHIVYRQFYAMGYDAFLVHRNIEKLHHEESIPLFGATGMLSLSGGVIRRQGKWAQFKRGKVSEIQP
jgi:outer membrane PBP1 activator LpoA protein